MKSTQNKLEQVAQSLDNSLRKHRKIVGAEHLPRISDMIRALSDEAGPNGTLQDTSLRGGWGITLRRLQVRLAENPINPSIDAKDERRLYFVYRKHFIEVTRKPVKAQPKLRKAS
jgi:hypothetical protein